jgi:hypothetical protein
MMNAFELDDPFPTLAMATFKSFISEKEIEAVNKKRQEEWERVRRPDQPLGELKIPVITSLAPLMYSGLGVIEPILITARSKSWAFWPYEHIY